MIFWRISNFADLSGIGGLKQAARWHNVGRPIVYLAEHPSLALLEVLANTEAEDVPSKLQILKIKSQKVKVLKATIQKTLIDSKVFGSNWLEGHQSALLKVPSVLAPNSWNYLLNPLHPDAAKIEIADILIFDLDQRLR